MDKFPVWWNEKSWGELEVRKDGLYTWFCARCRLPEKGLWCVWATGEEGDLRIGVLEPCENEAEIKRRFSESITKPIGQIKGGELRWIKMKSQQEWSCGGPALFRTSWIQKEMMEMEGILVSERENGKEVAIPFSVNQKFPLTALFCFAEIRIISGKSYAVFSFDTRERPVFKSDFRK